MYWGTYVVVVEERDVGNLDIVRMCLVDIVVVVVEGVLQ